MSDKPNLFDQAKNWAPTALVCHKADYDALKSRLDAAEAEMRIANARESRANNAIRENDRLRQQLSERDAVLRDWYPWCGLTARQTQALRERTDALLSSAEPVKPECGCCGRTDRCDDDCDAAKGGDGEVNHD